MSSPEDSVVPDGNEEQKQPELELAYPCQWGYRLIGPDGDEIKRMVAAVLGDRPYQITAGKTSSGGKYVSLNLQLEVSSEEDRKSLFKTLSVSPAVKVIL
ncbi:MAG: DUF493 domain-containing protein [Phycisphaerales bacterium]|nr:DUF493 domain-containing protein [Phycisphaerales bacterium]